MNAPATVRSMTLRFLIPDARDNTTQSTPKIV